MYGYTLSEAQRMMDAVPCERCAEMVGTSKNAAWLIGHLAVAADMMNMFAGGEMTLSSWHDLYAPGKEPKPDRSLYPKKAELMETLAERHAAVDKHVVTLTQSDFETPLPLEKYREFFPTIGHAAVYFMASHEMYHLGQLSVWRNAAGIG